MFRRGKREAARKIKKKVQFSKVILAGVTAITLGVVAFSCVMIAKTGDLSPLSYLIPAVFAELATATGFYYRKAEKENTAGGIIYDQAMGNQRKEEQHESFGSLFDAQ